MEVQLAVKSASRTSGRATPPHHIHVGDTTTKAAAVPNYLKPSTGSCHHACKYGGAHTFEERDAHRPNSNKTTTRKQQQPPPAVSDDHHQKKRTTAAPLVRARLVPRKLFSRGDYCKVEDVVAAGAVNEKTKTKTQTKAKKKAGDDSSVVEWKDIVAYDMVVPSQGSLIPELIIPQLVDGDAKDDKKESSPDKKLQQVNKAPVVGSSKMMTGEEVPSTEPATTHTNTDTNNKGVIKPPRGKKPDTTVLVVAKRKAVVDRELVDGYQPLSPSLLQSRASLLRDLEEEMMLHEAATNRANESKTAYCSLDQEECAAAAEASRPIPAHRRAKSMSISSRSSVRFPFARQASRNSSSATFKLRSNSSKAGPAILPSEEEKIKPARIRSRRGSMGGGDDVGSTGNGRGIQLRIRSLRRRGVGGATSTGFVVPAVSLRHQKTLEKKRSQRLYNNVIEETASKLVKTRKSRVKALVGAFESVISRIAK